ncbi:hypothetical protein GYMLUDRAFT_233483 [Collybiopsis luxurians FD-317 M1]|uniref:DyP dimeric alpha+beta barrel domain-containing protein n=1 Tax=Collybiopsis luxurians FD-317 M1 TaxID=944289 RepID=A0A0D0BD79_9AGAR|nr:hypothetical protein GYMLUDRAFT_233483 [Collybiopsis luxurians FD-317 M1]
MSISYILDPHDPEIIPPRRSIIPSIHPDSTPGKILFGGISREPLPDLKDVQGDIVYLFPKRAENFIFFRIADVPSFKKALAKFKPSSAHDTATFIFEIAKHKKSVQAGGKVPIIKKASYQIAFSRMGMDYLGVRDETGDVRFDHRAMRDDKDMLGDQMQWDPEFNKKDFDPVHGSANKDDGTALHGVITVAAGDDETCDEYTKETIALFGESIKVVIVLEGRARPGDNAGHEHFGYKDGISQPALRNLTSERPGQIQVNCGVVIIGFKGDPVIDGAGQRPAWTKGGTMMVFRKLQQYVQLFNAYLEKNGPRWKDFVPAVPQSEALTDKQGEELWGARMIGRWKSGAPIALCPYKDNPEVAANPDMNNNFDYTIDGVNGLTDLYCPFSAHTRKTVPRNIDPYVQRAFLESSMMVRAGLPYGPEVQVMLPGEDPNEDLRGLLFISYQSSLDQGFVRQTVSFANNDYFPITSLVPTHTGQDPIIGGPPAANTPAAVATVEYDKPPEIEPKTGDLVNLATTSEGNIIEVSGFAKVRSASAVDPPGVPQEFFVTSRGGEYFFVPPISTVTEWASS